MRPPCVSLILFAAAAAFLIWGAVSVRGPAPTHQALFDDASPVAEAAPALPAAPDFSWRFNALDPRLGGTAVTSALFDPSDDYWGLPRTDGYDLVAGYCTACHSLRIVMQQSASETRWRALLTWMVEKQGMAPPSDEDLEAIVRYLSENFGA